MKKSIFSSHQLIIAAVIGRIPLDAIKMKIYYEGKFGLPTRGGTKVCLRAEIRNQITQEELNEKEGA